MGMQGVSLSATSSMDVQDVFLSTTSRMDVQGKGGHKIVISLTVTFNR
jgi:hypothetical protein